MVLIGAPHWQAGNGDGLAHDNPKALQRQGVTRSREPGQWAALDYQAYGSTVTHIVHSYLAVALSSVWMSQKVSL
jgi:hypothetical protein